MKNGEQMRVLVSHIKPKGFYIQFKEIINYFRIPHNTLVFKCTWEYVVL